MDRGHLRELHYITPTTNLGSIHARGILSHRRAQALSHQSIAMQEVQDIRARKTVPGGRPLHEYANLYVNARNPMLYKRSAEFGSLVILRLNATVLDLAEVVVTDQNAASDYVRFAAAPAGLVIVNEEYTFSEYWTHPDDQIEEWRHRSRMCAEVLVPDTVPSGFIVGAYAASESVAAKLSEAEPALAVSVNARMFFR